MAWTDEARAAAAAARAGKGKSARTKVKPVAHRGASGKTVMAVPKYESAAALEKWAQGVRRSVNTGVVGATSASHRTAAATGQTNAGMRLLRHALGGNPYGKKGK